jgi:large subunit ribosomal protein L25
MPEIRIVAESRTEFGKGAARRIRRAGRVPAVLSSHGEEPVHLSLPEHEIMMALKTPNALLRLEFGGTTQLALPKEVQRHPVRRVIEHVDLLQVKFGEKVVVEVPVETTGDIVPGGLLDHVLNTLSVKAEATHLPREIQVSVEGLDVGAAVHAGDIPLPAGVELAGEPDALVLHVMAAPTAEQMESDGSGETPVEAVAEAEPAAEGAED